MERISMAANLDNDIQITYIPPTQEAAPEETTGQSVLRNLGRTGMRAVESAYGLPGDVAQGLLNVANLGIEKGLGVPSPLPTKTPIPTSERIRESLQAAPEHLSPEAKEKLKGKFEEISKPRGKVEEFSDEFIKDLVPLTLTGVSPASAAKISGLGNLAAWGTKEIGAGPGWQSGAKIGTMFLASIPGNGPKLRQYMNNLYDQAESSIPANAQISAKTLEPRLDKLRALTSKGIETPAKKEITKIVEQLESKIRNGNISLSEAWQTKKDLNELLFSGTPVTGLEKNLNPLVKDFNALLQQAGKESPDFVKYLREADDIYRGLNQSSFIKQKLNKYVTGDKSLYAITSGLLGGYPGAAIKGVGLAHGAKSVVNFLEPFARSNAIKKRYYDIASSVFANKIPTAVKNIKLLDKEIRKEISSPANDIEITYIPQ